MDVLFHVRCIEFLLEQCETSVEFISGWFFDFNSQCFTYLVTSVENARKYNVVAVISTKQGIDWKRSRAWLWHFPSSLGLIHNILKGLIFPNFLVFLDGTVQGAEIVVQTHILLPNRVHLHWCRLISVELERNFSHLLFWFHDRNTTFSLNFGGLQTDVVILVNRNVAISFVARSKSDNSNSKIHLNLKFCWYWRITFGF